MPAGAGSARGCWIMVIGSPALAAYLAVSRLAGPVAGWLLAHRAARGREDSARLGERLGRAGMARPDGGLIWLHGASVGEALSMLPLIAEIRGQAPGVSCLVTTGTVTSARRMAELLPDGCIHQYVPVDTGAAVRGFLDHWQPDLAVWVESEFWPGLMTSTARRGIPMMLINARMSRRSAWRWGRVPGMAAALIQSFRQIVTQDKVTVTRLLELGADPARLREGGNLKALVPVPDCDEREVEQLRRLLAGRPAWLAASTHEPEEEAIATAHQFAARSLTGLLTILAPRHPERGDAVAAMLAGRGLSVARRSLGEVPVVTTGVWLADTMGEMGLWLRLSPVCFIGGSIAPLGGHNPFEAAALGSAILHGPETRNFEHIYAVLDKAGGARMVVDGGAIGGAIVVLIESEMARRAMTDAARAIHGKSNPDVVRLAREARELMESA